MSGTKKSTPANKTFNKSKEQKQKGGGPKAKQTLCERMITIRVGNQFYRLGADQIFSYNGNMYPGNVKEDERGEVRIRYFNNNGKSGEAEAVITGQMAANFLKHKNVGDPIAPEFEKCILSVKAEKEKENAAGDRK